MKQIVVISENPAARPACRGLWSCGWGQTDVRGPSMDAVRAALVAIIKVTLNVKRVVLDVVEVTPEQAQQEA